MIRRTPRATRTHAPCPYTTLFRSPARTVASHGAEGRGGRGRRVAGRVSLDVGGCRDAAVRAPCVHPHRSRIERDTGDAQPGDGAGHLYRAFTISGRGTGRLDGACDARGGQLGRAAGRERG